MNAIQSVKQRADSLFELVTEIGDCENVARMELEHQATESSKALYDAIRQEALEAADAHHTMTEFARIACLAVKCQDDFTFETSMREIQSCHDRAHNNYLAASTLLDRMFGAKQDPN